MLDLALGWPLHTEAAQLRAALPASALIGTSSWTYPGWSGIVYNHRYPLTGKTAEMLEEYCRFPLFATVGIDSSFYNPLTPDTLTRYRAALPSGFRCVTKAWDRITIQTFGEARDKHRAGERNPDFLNAPLFLEAVYQPLQAHFADHLGPIVFEFQAMLGAHKPAPLAFANQLDRFFSQLPPEGRFAVEIRNADFLTPTYFAVLREHNVSHVFNAWTWMPPIGVQLDLPDAITADFLVVRATLTRETTHSAVMEAFAPYDQIHAPNAELRADLVRVIRTVDALRLPGYIIVNNLAEGSAPLTAMAVARAATGG